MTIKDLAAEIGVSHQAVYKRLGAHGIKLEKLKDRKTGQLTEEGKCIILQLYSAQTSPDEESTAPLPTDQSVPGNEDHGHEETDLPAVKEEAEQLHSQIEKLKKQIALLNDEVESLKSNSDWLRKEAGRLRNQVETMQAREKALIDERDFLRISLERSQQLQALTASKIPAPPPALPAGSMGSKIRNFFNRISLRKKQDQQ